jgi:hypothetical protein
MHCADTRSEAAHIGTQEAAAPALATPKAPVPPHAQKQRQLHSAASTHSFACATLHTTPRPRHVPRSCGTRRDRAIARRAMAPASRRASLELRRKHHVLVGHQELPQEVAIRRHVGQPVDGRRAAARRGTRVRLQSRHALLWGRDVSSGSSSYAWGGFRDEVAASCVRTCGTWGRANTAPRAWRACGSQRQGCLPPHAGRGSCRKRTGRQRHGRAT